MTWGIDDVESRFKKVEISDDEDDGDSNNGRSSLPQQSSLAMTDEALHRPDQFTGQLEEDSGDEDDINIRDTSKTEKTVRGSWKDSGSSSGDPTPWPSSTIPDTVPSRQYIPSASAVQSSYTPSGFEEGEVADNAMTFVPFKLVERYPRLYIGKNNQDLVSWPSSSSLLTRTNHLSGGELFRHQPVSEPGLVFVSLHSLVAALCNSVF